MGFFNLEALDFETYQNDVFFFLPPENKRLEPPQTVPSIWVLECWSPIHKKGAVAPIAAHVMQKENN